MNRIYEVCIRESKPKPDFTHTDAYHVWLTLHGEVQHPEFLRFLEKLGKEQLESFTTQDLLAIDNVFREEPVSDCFKENLLQLVDRGVIEQISRGRGTRYVLSRQFYEFIGKRGVYTRKRGLDKETNKSLLLKHLRDCGSDGCKFEELKQVLPMLSRYQIHSLLRALKAEKKIRVEGRTRAGRWFVQVL
jgi:ATP-dependent DNA helicase RecG